MENSRKLIWSFSAKKDLQNIYDYYSKISVIIANRIMDRIMESSSVLEIAENENIGQFDEYNNKFRRIISGNYKNFNEHILIVRVFDSRQNPII